MVLPLPTIDVAQHCASWGERQIAGTGLRLARRGPRRPSDDRCGERWVHMTTTASIRLALVPDIAS